MEGDLIEKDPKEVLSLTPGDVSDYGYWAMMDYWTLEEALCLVNGHRPDHNNFLVHFIYRNHVELITRNIKDGRIKQSDNPVRWCVWLTQGGFEVPMLLLKAVEQAHTANIEQELKKQQPIQIVKRTEK
ncbi:MAG: hypothetical protein ACREUA_07305 [Burkholderiales bacterium]